MLKKLIIPILILSISPKISNAALPFVTDDAMIANRDELIIEAFSEFWRLPQKNNLEKTNMFGQYFGLSYGVAKKLEITAGGLIAYDFKDNRAAFMNPVFQLKTKLYNTKKTDIAASLGYVNRNGRGQYYDSAENIYTLAIITDRFFDDKLLIHINIGPKASYNINLHDNIYRLHLGVGFDFGINNKKDIRVIAEIYNGAPNSPRDSYGFFHSYQTGFRYIVSNDLSFHILYGSQPTFAGYGDDNSLLYRKTNWIQFGVRKSVDDLLKYI